MNTDRILRSLGTPPSPQHLEFARILHERMRPQILAAQRALEQARSPAAVAALVDARRARLNRPGEKVDPA